MRDLPKATGPESRVAAGCEPRSSWLHCIARHILVCYVLSITDKTNSVKNCSFLYLGIREDRVLFCLLVQGIPSSSVCPEMEI